LNKVCKREDLVET